MVEPLAWMEPLHSCDVPRAANHCLRELHNSSDWFHHKLMIIKLKNALKYLLLTRLSLCKLSLQFTTTISKWKSHQISDNTLPVPIPHLQQWFHLISFLGCRNSLLSILPIVILLPLHSLHCRMRVFLAFFLKQFFNVLGIKRKLISLACAVRPGPAPPLQLQLLVH